MGHFTRGSGVWPDVKIRCFEPDNDENTLWIDINYSSISISEILERCSDHFGKTTLDELTIEAENIHTDCLGYDEYDPTDYTMYLKITRVHGKKV